MDYGKALYNFSAEDIIYVWPPGRVAKYAYRAKILTIDENQCTYLLLDENPQEKITVTNLVVANSRQSNREV